MCMDYYALTDAKLAELIGKRLRALRLRKNRTQGQLAERTTLSVGTIQALESGRGKIENLISVLRELNALDGIDAFLPEPPKSPLAMAKKSRRTKHGRKRASKSRGKTLPSSEDKDISTW